MSSPRRCLRLTRCWFFDEARVESSTATLSPLVYEHWRATPLGRLTEQSESRLVFDLAGSLAGKRVLDVGTGDGAVFRKRCRFRVPRARPRARSRRSSCGGRAWALERVGREATTPVSGQADALERGALLDPARARTEAHRGGASNRGITRRRLLPADHCYRATHGADRPAAGAARHDRRCIPLHGCAQALMIVSYP